MRGAGALILLATFAMAGCQSTTGDDANAVPASTLPPGMAATATVGGGGAPTDLADLVNKPAKSAASQMTARGYASVSFQDNTAYWWNARAQVCASVVTANGKFQSIGTATARFCGQ